MPAMKPGTYSAHIVNYTISENSQGGPQVEILFEYTDGEGLSGTPHQIRWWGQLTEKSLPYVLKTLYMLGYRGTTTADLSKLTDGVESGMLDLGKEVELVLVEAERKGKTYIDIKYINEPGFAPKRISDGISKDKVRVKLGALNIEGQMALVRQEMEGHAKAAPKPAANTAPRTREPGEDDDFNVGF
jgi:hypothetical protein